LFEEHAMKAILLSFGAVLVSVITSSAWTQAFVSTAKIDMRHIPYKGSGMARADLLGGQVKLGCLGISSVINSHRAGQLWILAVTSGQRSAQLPDIPSIAETVPGYEATLWSGLLAPAGTPPAAINRIHEEVARLVQRPDVKAALTATGTDVVVRGPKEYAALLKVEFEKWGKVVREINLQIN
jgi:tripartite-type tricarboxylate transporter receptor subunit TctC